MLHLIERTTVDRSQDVTRAIISLFLDTENLFRALPRCKSLRFVSQINRRNASRSTTREKNLNYESNNQSCTSVEFGQRAKVFLRRNEKKQNL